jgi:phosphinothricin acetyltransferase
MFEFQFGGTNMHDTAHAPYRSDAELQQLVQAFEECTLTHDRWDHPAHLSVAAWYTLRFGDQAIKRIRDGIQRLNRSHGVETTPTRGYHETITVAWARLIAAHLRALDPSATDFEKVNSVVSAFGDKMLLLRHYTRDRLMSADARYGWLEPDLEPLPWTGVVVRPATEGDLPSVLAILNHEIEHGYAHFGVESLQLRELVGTWRETQRRYPWLVAETDCEVVGFCRASPWKSRGGYAWTTEIGVYVRSDCQGQGIGRRLYEQLFPALERAGFRTILAGVALPNDASVRLHESFGMRKCAHMPAVGFKLGAWRDVAYWTLRVGGEGPP